MSKEEHHEGRGIRSVPIFTELLPILLAAWDAAPEGAEYVVAKQAYRDAAQRPGGWANANLRSQFEKRRSCTENWRTKRRSNQLH